MEKMIFENDELLIEYEEIAGKTHRGARDSLGGVAGMGPPIEPDETEVGGRITKVSLFDVDLTSHFDTDAMDIEDLWESIEKTFKNLLEDL